MSAAAWIASFPHLGSLAAEDRQLLLDAAQRVSLQAGAVLFAPGAPAAGFVLVLDGTVRVQKVSSTGREIVLYRVSGGESCILTTACLLAEQRYDAEAVVETDGVDAVLVPRNAFDALMANSAGFRRFVFADYASRITDLLHLVEEVAFERIDKRLAQRLLARADVTGHLAATHQTLAVELGSAREVVSRHLKEFQRRGWLTLTRGHIHLLDREGLQQLAASD